MDIVFSRHAKLKIVQRKIPMRAVIAVVRFPEFRADGYNPREELYKKFRNIYLKVVIKRKRNKIIVITTHLVAKVKNN
ncbi:MAG: hypothetical protein A2666_05360 [Parcubacteria group bacterium RIFCSPHIGHO2_01_FULL_47_10b]|nr:MAG: hypothetical protein A2666_05360 [Parcubacteria group bacterium RIFCSPHIGHO2_01_FULL_47_10b]